MREILSKPQGSIVLFLWCMIASGKAATVSVIEIKSRTLDMADCMWSLYTHKVIR